MVFPTFALIAFCVLLSPVLSITTITVKGNAFFAGNDRFYIKGLDYQPGGQSKLTDPLADISICKRDIEVFKDLGLNAIRIYTVDNSANHDACMKLLSDAGIYLILDLNTPFVSINRLNPSSTYTADYLQNVFATIEVFSKYDNLLGFFSANEVVNDEKTTAAATYVKAVTRDIHRFMKARIKRQIPVGYSAADVKQNRLLMAKYLDCGSDPLARSDFFSVNDYSWCGESSIQKSGWGEKVSDYTDYPLPMFLSEYGCNSVPGARPFTEVPALYTKAMTSVFSGGLVYEYTQEQSNYGIVEIDKNGSITKLKDYTELKKQIGNISLPSDDGGYRTDLPQSSCPKFEKGVWEASDDLPSMPKDAETYIKNGAGTPKGIQNQVQGGSSSTGSTGSSGGSSASTDKSKEPKNSGADLGASIYVLFMATIVIAGSLAGIVAW